MHSQPALYFDFSCRRSCVARVGCPSWLNQQNMGFFLRNGPVLNASRDNVKLSRLEDDIPQFRLNCHDAFQNEEKKVIFTTITSCPLNCETIFGDQYSENLSSFSERFTASVVMRHACPSGRLRSRRGSPSRLRPQDSAWVSNGASLARFYSERLRCTGESPAIDHRNFSKCNATVFCKQTRSEKQGRGVSCPKTCGLVLWSCTRGADWLSPGSAAQRRHATEQRRAAKAEQRMASTVRCKSQDDPARRLRCRASTR